jgi:hypothetical protein
MSIQRLATSGRERYRGRESNPLRKNREGTRDPVTISGDEFVRRFLIHVLPPRLRRLRDYGLFAPHKWAENMELCRRLLACSNASLKQPPEVNEPEIETPTDAEGRQEPSERPCPRCGAAMIWLGKLTADAIRRLLARRTPLLPPLAWGDRVAQLPEARVVIMKRSTTIRPALPSGTLPPNATVVASPEDSPDLRLVQAPVCYRD